MSETKVLLIDKDIYFGADLVEKLKERGYDVCFHCSSMAVLEIVELFHPNVILFGIVTDDEMYFIPEIHFIALEVPILVLSPHVKSGMIRRVLEKGAITCLERSADFELIIAYIKRYAYSEVEKILFIGDSKLDLNSRNLFISSVLVRKLSPTEFKLLLLLIKRKNATVSIEHIKKEVWPGICFADEHTIYNYIGKLRKLLIDDSCLSIQTMPKGYVLCESN